MMIRALSLFLVVLSSSSVLAGESISVRLVAQLWSRPTGAENRTKFSAIGAPVPVAVELAPSARLGIGKFSVTSPLGDQGARITAHGTAILVPPKGSRRSFITMQTQLVHSEKGLIAECASYHSLAESSVGVGVCSGTNENTQYGVSFAPSDDSIAR